MKRSHLKYLAPNAITCIGLVLGLFSISRAIAHDFELAAWAVIWSALTDKLDGSVARLFNATSSIGMELDSFSDFTTFGIAPGALTYLYAQTHYPNWSLFWLVYVGVALYVVACALRLAKFNITSSDIGDQFFLGVPTTAAGSFVASAFLTMNLHGAASWLYRGLPVLLLVFAAAMLSRVKLPKVKARKNKVVNALQLLAVVLGYVFGFMMILPEYPLALITVYTVVGLVYHQLRPPKPPASPAEPQPGPAQA